jgi:hypothetical protein
LASFVDACIILCFSITGIKLCPPIPPGGEEKTNYTATTLHLGLEKSKDKLQSSIRLDDFAALEAAEAAAKEGAETEEK